MVSPWQRGAAFISSPRYRRIRVACLVLVLASLLEIWIHIRSFNVTSPLEPLDPPFAAKCAPSYDHVNQDALYVAGDTAPADSLGGRENATLLMLARNSDLKGAVQAITSLEERWNKWYNYPIVFLNNEEWDEEFINALSAVSSGKAVFETIPKSMWSWPTDKDGADVIDRTVAQAAWDEMEANGIPYAAKESYHHMCRFYSGFFQDHPAVTPYKYYWRVEPGVKFTCRIPYDPFRAMRRKGKVYGYTVALWEIGSACPSLFRTIADYKEATTQGAVESTSLWTSLMDPSWAPLPLRRLLMSLPSLFHSRDRRGDAWNHCHFWSNFEIADFDFFRSEAYRRLFRQLDASGGFFMERWGDAPVHSLALAMLADPRQVHYFEDIGYQHAPFQHCPSDAVGCDCDCSGKGLEEVSSECLDRIRKGLDPR